MQSATFVLRTALQTTAEISLLVDAGVNKVALLTVDYLYYFN